MFHALIELLVQQPLILFFLVVAIGYPLGHLKLGGGSLGVAAVLFVGLAFGALDERLKLPEILYQLGLVLFVYCIGLNNGQGFFRALRSGGLRSNLLVVAALLLATAGAALIHTLIGLNSAQTAGLYAGSLTNTPALAAVIESIKLTTPANLQEQLLNDPVVGYSIAYPMGVLGMILALSLAQRWWKPDYAKEAQDLQHLGAVSEDLVSETIRVTNNEACQATVSELLQTFPRHVIFARRRHGQEVSLVTGSTQLTVDDQVSVIGPPDEVKTMVAQLGEVENEQLADDRSLFDFRRVFVSSPQVIGHTIGELQLPDRFGALVTRLRRGDMELLATANMVLEPGDRIRVVALRSRMREVTDFFGDSYKALSEIDFLTFALGLVIGLLVGQIPIPIPGGEFRLGIAGGPLIVALVLSTIERTGPLVWVVPYSANLTLRQFGVVLFLAGIGTRAGYAFVSTLLSSGGLLLFLSGAVLTWATALITLWVGYKLLKIPLSLLSGVLSGLQTNPAILSYATKQTDNDIPNIGYATVYPAAMIIKIVLAQLLLTLLR